MSLVLDFLFPKYCLKCHKHGSYFCQSCLDKQGVNSPMFTNKNPNLEGTLSLFKYHDLIKKIITNIKYEFVTDIIDSLVDTSSSLIKANFPNLLLYWQQNNFTLVPIPLHPLRQNWRGFNQSILIGQRLAQELNLKFSDQILFRSKNTLPQAKITHKSKKISNLQDAFYCSDQNIPSNIIIFDDVSTTSSTLNSALKTLSNCGVQNHCWFLTLSGH